MTEAINCLIVRREWQQIFLYTYGTGDMWVSSNFGDNGSENFAPGSRYGYFPAFAFGWIVSQEEFMQPVATTISNLKIRGSWGEAGNSI